MPYLTHGSVVLRYRVSGAGPPLLLIRGFLRSQDYWLELEPLLARSFRTVVFDHRGVGGSDAPPPPYSSLQMADDAVAVLDALEIRRSHVFGLSLGGMVAQMVAIHHPSRVERLALGGSTASLRAGRDLPPRALLQLLGASVLPSRWSHRLSSSLVLSPAGRAAARDVPGQWRALAQRWPVPRRGLLGQLAAAAFHDARRDLTRIAAPCLVLHGSADRLIPLAQGERLAAGIPGARMQVIEGAGHDFPAEQPERIAATLREFFLAAPPAEAQ